MIYRLPEILKLEKEIENIALVKNHGHQKLEGDYQGKNSRLVIYCPKHNVIAETTYANYKRCRTGLPCCGKQQVSDKLKGRVYNEDTIDKMRTASKNRPSRGGSDARYWRKTNSYIQWRKNVFRLWNSEGSITGLKSSDTELVAHHFFNASNGEKFACNTKNGILLEKSLHILYHKIFGFRQNTLEQFQTFLLLLLNRQVKPTSSQGENSLSSSYKEFSQGSETRVLDSQRIERLHECLGELGKVLKKELFEDDLKKPNS